MVNRGPYPHRVKPKMYSAPRRSFDQYLRILRMPNWSRPTCGTLLLAAVLPNACLAAPMAVIFMEGSKPTRVVYAAEFLDVQDRTNALNLLLTDQGGKPAERQRQMRVIAIHEDPAAPESIDMSVEFMCSQNRFRLNAAHAMNRDGSDRRFSTKEWQSYGEAKSAWPQAASEIACRNEAVANAVKQAQASTGERDLGPLEKLGIFYIGESDRLETVDTVWKTFLADGNRPAYAPPKLTDSELAAKLATIDEKLGSLKEMNESAMALAGAEFGRLKEERQFKNEISRNAGRRGQLGWLLGQTEQDIVRFAGRPHDFHEGHEVRQLIYYNEYSIAGAGYIRDQNGNYLVTSTRVTCEIRIDMKRGGASSEYRAVDYRLIASHGGCRDLSWFSK